MSHQRGPELRHIVVIRHAKSSWDDPSIADHDRPLSKRGRNALSRLRDHIEGLELRPELVMCSSSLRTRETLARTRIDAPVNYADRLYDATPGAVIEEINGVDPTVETLLVIGHEPAMSQVALGLAAAEGGNPTAAESISTKFPTSAIAVLRTGEPWDQLTLSGAALVTFHVPR